MSLAGDRGNDWRSYEQPGLEVVPHERLAHSEDWSGLQAVDHGYYHDGNKEVVSQHNDAEKMPVVTNEAELEPAGQSSTSRRKRLWLLIGGGISVIVIVAAVVGGVLGSRAAREPLAEASQPTDEANRPGTPSPTATANSTTRLASIRQGSPLTVTGWQKAGGSEIFLFYQDHDNQIQRSVYNTTSGNPSWHSPVKFNSFATAGSRLGGSVIQYDSAYLPQTELFYANDDKRLLGVSMNDQLSPSYEEDSIKNMFLSTSVNSSVGAYWPWVTYQGTDGELVEVRNRLRSEFSPAAEWDAKKLGVKAANASRLALVPLSTNFSQIAVQGGYGIFYQGTDARLTALIPDLDSKELADDYATSWPTADFPSIVLREGGTFAAFSVARASDSLQRVDTYLLYLDTSSNINVIYTDSSSWKEVQPAVLKEVDSDTDIACLTMATTHRDSFKNEVLLEEASDQVRCYFQRQGLVKEVTLSGTQWVEIGNVPIP